MLLESRDNFPEARMLAQWCEVVVVQDSQAVPATGADRAIEEIDRAIELPAQR